MNYYQILMWIQEHEATIIKINPDEYILSYYIYGCRRNKIVTDLIGGVLAVCEVDLT